MESFENYIFTGDDEGCVKVRTSQTFLSSALLTLFCSIDLGY
jgi:hypothetical protein